MYFIIFVILMRWNVPFDKVEGSFREDEIFLITSHHFIFVLIVASFLPFHLFHAFFLSFFLFIGHFYFLLEFSLIYSPIFSIFSFILYILLHFLHSPLFSTFSFIFCILLHFLHSPLFSTFSYIFYNFISLFTLISLPHSLPCSIL